jgi:DNA-directed RNA polymerase specialized sigma subunit
MKYTVLDDFELSLSTNSTSTNPLYLLARYNYADTEEEKQLVEENLLNLHAMLEPIEIDALSLLFIYEIEKKDVAEILNISKKRLGEILRGVKTKLG